MKFLAKIIFRINRWTDEYEFDEQLHIIEAPSASEALVTADNIGRENEEWVLCDSGEKILWEFIGVSELFVLNTTQSRIYSFTSKYNGKDYINFVRSRHKNISETNREKFIQSFFADADQAGMAHL